MQITAIQGIVENGQIRLSENVRLPEKATVYVIFPELQNPAAKRISGPRLARKEDAARFKKIVEDIGELEDAEV
jgi:hypothetical protein